MHALHLPRCPAPSLPQAGHHQHASQPLTPITHPTSHRSLTKPAAACAAASCGREPHPSSTAARAPAAPGAARSRWADTLRSAAASAAVSAALLAASSSFAPAPALAAADATPLTSSMTVYDLGNIVAQESEQQLSQRLADFERETGWRVRVFTSYGPGFKPYESQLRSAWQLDKQTVVLEFDPTSPNVMNFYYIGDNALFKLRRPWWFELQSRYGNKFFVRDEGEQASVLAATDALVTCLGKPDGCAVVPGLPSEQYAFTLALSAIAGLIAGFVSKLEPQGFIQRRWLWLVVFSPLWANVFVNFGLGPVLSRTDDRMPVAGNVLGFLAGAAAPYVVQRVLQAPPPAAGRDS